ncbi:hypothetical protein EXIGLDRAFT_780722 [Exidia glandulosa HHB12029]|uniref:Uncharacterized protein n=1 Tax=Exidia glandulosa HHB12029 TaxID=1314781 RepID=A0A165BGY5_EXIGL|nr:hypothetical protein EXIGLDRAFT_780722 [Exidia glandulosa HHB12029]
MSTFSKHVLSAIDDLYTKTFPLVQGGPDIDVCALRFNWDDDKKKSSGSWCDAAGNEVVLSMLVQVSERHSKLRSYGNAFVARDQMPTLPQVKGFKFVVGGSIGPVLDLGHPDFETHQKLKYQVAQLAALQRQFERQQQRVDRTNSWYKTIEDAEGDIAAFIIITLGPVFTTGEKSVSVEDFMNFSPKKKETKPVVDKIVHDPMLYISSLPDAERADLQHNDQLPIFLSDGKRVGRTSPEIQSALYDGRWIVVDAKPVVWNIKDGNSGMSRTFQLIAKRVTILPKDTPMMNIGPASPSGQARLGLVYLDNKGEPESLLAESESKEDDGEDDEDSTLSETPSSSPLKRGREEDEASTSSSPAKKHK